MNHHNFDISILDTDSLTISKPDGSPFDQAEIDKLTKQINDISDELIRWEFEFYIPRIVVIRAKNYIMYDGKKIKTKGSATRDQKKEKALSEMMAEIIEALCYDKLDTIKDIYHKFVIEATNPTDILRWSSKKNASEAVLNCMGYEKYTPEQLKKKEIRPNETNIWDAIKMEELVQAGDRFFLYPAILGSTSTFKTYKNGKTKETKVYKYGFRQAKVWNKEDHDIEQLLKRVYDTLSIFETVLDINQYLDYSKVKNKEALQKLLTTT